MSKKLNDLRNTSIEKIWRGELEDLMEAWERFRTETELDYENDKKGIVSEKQKKKKTIKKTK
jgi:protoporphyrinogen oxidase